MNISNDIIKLNLNQEQAIKSELSKFAAASISIPEIPEEEKQRKNQSIAQKIEAGKKLTSSELSFLQRYNPILYAKVTALQQKREVLENQLKQCKSKQEAEDLVNDELGRISKEDPDASMKIASLKDIIKEFKKTSDYQKLPQTSTEEEKDVIHVGKLGSYQETFENTGSNNEWNQSFDSCS